VNQSFDDLADAQRPQFTESANVVGYVYAYGTPDLESLYNDFIAKAKDLFNLGELKGWEWAQDPDYIPPRIVRSATGKPRHAARVGQDTKLGHVRPATYADDQAEALDVCGPTV